MAFIKTEVSSLNDANYQATTPTRHANDRWEARITDGVRDFLTGIECISEERAMTRARDIAQTWNKAIISTTHASWLEVCQRYFKERNDGDAARVPTPEKNTEPTGEGGWGLVV